MQQQLACTRPRQAKLACNGSAFCVDIRVGACDGSRAGLRRRCCSAKHGRREPPLTHPRRVRGVELHTSQRVQPGSGVHLNDGASATKRGVHLRKPANVPWRAG